jgi:hypothetical protein
VPHGTSSNPPSGRGSSSRRVTFGFRKASSSRPRSIPPPPGQSLGPVG